MRKKRTIAAVLLLVLMSILAPSHASAQAWTPCSGPTCPVTFGQMIDEVWLNTFVINNSGFLFNNLGALGGFVSGSSSGTHPDGDKATSQILVRGIERAVLDNGRGVANVGSLVCDITMSGAGGRDTGTEQASTWYQYYLIHKSSDGTKNCLLHRSKDFFKDEDYDNSDTFWQIRKATGAFDAVSQGFKVDTTGPLPFVDVELMRAGTVTGAIWAEIRTDNSGVPSSTVLATSDKLNAAFIATSEQFLRFVFRGTPASLTATTQYHLVMTGDWTPSDANYIRWSADTGGVYANGTPSKLSAGTWTLLNGATYDFSFRGFITRNDTAVTMPSGYDGKALLGWVYNNGSSNFATFSARDRTVTPAAQTFSSGLSATTTKLIDMAAFLPPVPVTVTSVVVLNAGSPNVHRQGGVPDGYFPESSSPALIAGDATSITLAGTLLPYNTEFQAVYLKQDAGTTSVYMGQWIW